MIVNISRGQALKHYDMRGLGFTSRCKFFLLRLIYLKCIFNILTNVYTFLFSFRFSVWKE